MIPILFFLTAIFTSWYGYPGDYHQYTTFESDNLEFDCKHTRADGCLIQVNNTMAIVLPSIESYALKGCTIQTHEFLHLMGYEEWEIPKCIKSQEFRK